LALVYFVLAILALPFKSKSWLEPENAALRHQVMVLRRQVRGRVYLANLDRLFLVQLYHWFPPILRGVCSKNFIRVDEVRESPNLRR